MIKKFKQFDSEVEKICRRYRIRNWNLNSDTNLVDVDGNVNLTNKGLNKIPLRFGKITGDFLINGNNGITSLEGSPNYVGGSFDCSCCRISTLVGSPRMVGSDFKIHQNNLTNFIGCPDDIGFNSDLKGIYCMNNQINTFKGIPENLLDGIEFNCHGGNPIWEIVEIFGYWVTMVIPNGTQPIKQTVFEVENYDFIDLINDLNVIQNDGRSIVLDRLEEVFHILGRDLPKDLTFKNYTLL